MSMVCVVHVPHSLEKFLKTEADNPHITEVIVAAASKYITGHRVASADGEVIEINEFASAEDYDAFIAEAGDAIEQLGELLGAPAVDKLYTYAELPHG